MFSCSSNNQKPSKAIFFYKPYTDSTETNIPITQNQTFNYETQYYNIKSANVLMEVNYAMSQNDFRIIALSGASYVYPGLEGGYKVNSDGSKTFIGLASKYELHYEKYGFKVINGTSDAIKLDQLPLQSVAYEFAKEYNMKLFQKMKM